MQFLLVHHSGTSWLLQKLRQIIKSSHKTCFLVSVHISLKLFSFSALLWRSSSLCDTPESRWNWHEHNYHNKQGPTIIIKSNKIKSELSIFMIIVSSSDPDHNITSNQQSPVRKWLLRTLSPQNGVIGGVWQQVSKMRSPQLTDLACQAGVPDVPAWHHFEEALFSWVAFRIHLPG